MEQVKAVKLQLKPDKETSNILDGQSKIANWTYNHLLEVANQLRQEYKEKPSEEISQILYTKRGLRNLLPELKKKYPFLKSVHSSVLKNSALRLSDSIRTYQKSHKGKRKGKKTGWPKFRSWKQGWFSLLYDEPEKGYCVKEGNLHLSLGLGEERKQKSLVIPICDAGKLEGRKIRNIRIVKQASVWSAVFTVETEVTPGKAIESLGSSYFTPTSFHNFSSFISKLIAGETPICRYLRNKLWVQLEQLTFCGEADYQLNQKTFCEELNKLMITEDFHTREELFASVTLCNTTKRLISQNPCDLELNNLKRRLIEDAYREEIKRNQTIIALDPNHKNFAYGVDSQGRAIEIEAPHWLKIYDKRIDELKAKRDRCKKRSKQVEILDKEGKATGKMRWLPSRRWTKYNHVLERALAKRREQTKTFLFTLANFLCGLYAIVIVGDYTPRGGGLSRKMRRAMNNRSLIGRFKEVLSWVALKSGKIYDSFKEKGTTRTCCQCGYVVKDGIPPDVRLWTCKKCHYQHIRDENAARNGLANYLRELEKKGEGAISLSVPCSGPVTVMARWGWRVRPSGVASVALRGEDRSSATSAN